MGEKNVTEWKTATKNAVEAFEKGENIIANISWPKPRKLRPPAAGTIPLYSLKSRIEIQNCYM